MATTSSKQTTAGGSDFLETMIKRVPLTYERNLVASLIHSHSCYLTTKDSLCPWDETRGTRRADFSTSHYNILYDVISLYWDLFKNKKPATTPIPQPQLEAILIDWANNGSIALDIIEKILEEVRDDLYKMEITAEFIESAVLGEAYKYWISTRLAKRTVDELSYRSRNLVVTIENCQEVIDRFKDLQPITGAKVESGAQHMRNTIRVAPKLGSSLTKLDAAIGGGYGIGQTTLIGGISGGGKTVLACQLALDFAKQRRNVVYVTTEMTPASLVARMASNHLNADYGLFTQRREMLNTVKQGELPETKELQPIPKYMWEDANYGPELLKLENWLGKHMYFVDWSQGGTQSIMQNLDSELDQLARLGWPIDAVVFDWIGGGLDQSDKKLDLRLVYKNAIDHLVRSAKQRHFAAITFAQLDKKEAINKPRPGMKYISECKSMADNVWNYIGISAMLAKDNTSVFDPRQYLYVEKSRDGTGGVINVERLFKFQRFHEPNGTSILPGGTELDNKHN